MRAWTGFIYNRAAGRIHPRSETFENVIGWSDDRDNRDEFAVSSDAHDGPYQTVSSILDCPNSRTENFRYASQIKFCHDFSPSPVGAPRPLLGEQPCRFGDGDMENDLLNFGKSVSATQASIRPYAADSVFHNFVCSVGGTE